MPLRAAISPATGEAMRETRLLTRSPKALWVLRAALGGVVGVFLAAALGCYHDKFQVKVNHPEEFVLPPHEPRFDKPPEAEFRIVPKTPKEQKPKAMMPAGGIGP